MAHAFDEFTFDERIRLYRCFPGRARLGRCLIPMDRAMQLLPLPVLSVRVTPPMPANTSITPMGDIEWRLSESNGGISSGEQVWIPIYKNKKKRTARELFKSAQWLENRAPIIRNWDQEESSELDTVQESGTNLECGSASKVSGSSEEGAGDRYEANVSRPVEEDHVCIVEFLGKFVPIGNGSEWYKMVRFA
jgi:hypothetical protein